MRKTAFTAAIIIALMAGAASPAYADKTFWGTTIGAGLGGLLGNQFGRGDGRVAATGLGVAMGAIVGNSIGESLDNADLAASARASSSYIPYSYYSPTYYYEPNYVAPPDIPTRTIYVPQPVYVTGGYVGAPYSNGYCREYTQTIQIGGQMQQIQGIACLQPDGTWRVER